MKYSNLISILRTELYSKSAPGDIVNNIMEKKLLQFSERYVNRHNKELLLIGAYLADIRISEAIEKGNINDHVEMALDYANEVFNKNDLDENEKDIVIEIIKTHHGGEQKYLESKIFKNADNFKFLEPKGLLHLFAAYYKEYTEPVFEIAAKRALEKLEEKYALTDLDEETIKEAQELYTKSKWMFDRMKIKL